MPRRIISAEAAAAKADPKNADAWWQLSSLTPPFERRYTSTLDHTSSTGHCHLRRITPMAGRVSAELCLTSGSPEWGEKALLRALKADANEDDAPRANSIGLYREGKRDEDEYPLLDRLSSLTTLSSYDQTRLGNFHLLYNWLLDAIAAYKSGLRSESNLADLFFLGLRFCSDPRSRRTRMRLTIGGWCNGAILILRNHKSSSTFICPICWSLRKSAAAQGNLADAVGIRPALHQSL